MTSASGQETTEETAAQLTAWLTSLVHNRQYGDLAQLRRVTADTSARIRAGWYAPNQDNREIYEKVALLFALYHRGVGQPTRGFGSFGAAARRIGRPGDRGPEDPGAVRLVDRIVASRRVPWRHLQHAITRLRACEQQPPSWTDLVVDLDQWNDRKARIAYGWAVDFHAPSGEGRKTSQKGRTT
ncbi:MULTISPECIES: type I-E CRISPR-associated protein Cse2/CasB [unclassified Streptomyces]|uniref:type I-E CRISPR-associated protein Cse2/CasB n=1 Tax=unclassified Streptomyces TaxID=2593676 RepID=UPI002E80E587|nr:type I-E CRISPR-associated protein Cse2/CasB [Streptomyces sp. NBC_00589]WTI42335.1 type I-E CRISPR-associated protein Cse2/CasB [Streptomyces sp. NBC_00775]WUB23983.1 type I-E CRISPR-associated protein Cse2/CasB [Streptomyces sp. NBC_00589]